MLTQIRVSKTPKIKTYMELLSRKYPALSESEIIKYLIGKEILESEMEENEYMAMVRQSPSYGYFPDEKDNDDKIYTPKDTEPLK